MRTQTFNVTLHPTVTTRLGSYDVIEADYVRIEQGCLCFRNKRLDAQQYPELVTIIAKGAWARVDTVPAGSYQKRSTLGDLPEFKPAPEGESWT